MSVKFKETSIKNLKQIKDNLTLTQESAITEGAVLELVEELEFTQNVLLEIAEALDSL